MLGATLAALGVDLTGFSLSYVYDMSANGKVIVGDGFMQGGSGDEGWIGAGPDTGENDDLVSALVLAHHAWIEWRRMGLVARNMSWDSVHGDRPPANLESMLSFANSQHWAMINRKARERKEKF